MRMHRNSALASLAVMALFAAPSAARVEDGPTRDGEPTPEPTPQLPPQLPGETNRQYAARIRQSGEDAA